MVKSMGGKLLLMVRLLQVFSVFLTRRQLRLGMEKNISKSEIFTLNKGTHMQKHSFGKSPKIIYKDHVLLRAQSLTDRVLVNVYEQSPDLGVGYLMLSNVTIAEAMETIDEVMADLECGDVA